MKYKSHKEKDFFFLSSDWLQSTFQEKLPEFKTKRLDYERKQRRMDVEALNLFEGKQKEQELEKERQKKKQVKF